MDATGILVLLFGLAVFLVILSAVVKNAVREGMLEAGVRRRSLARTSLPRQQDALAKRTIAGS
jgi:hypothetical protein